jgi:hypothetical protein
MSWSQLYLFFPLLFSITVLVVAVTEWVQQNQRLPIILGILAVLLNEGGTRIFLIMNVNNKVGLDAYNFLGMHIVGITALTVLIFAATIWYQRRRFLMYGLLSLVALLQLLDYALVLVSYSAGDS